MVRFEPASPYQRVAPRPVGDGLAVYDVPVDDFAVWRAMPRDAAAGVVRLTTSGSAIVVALSGSVAVGGVELGPGRAAYVPGDGELAFARRGRLPGDLDARSCAGGPVTQSRRPGVREQRVRGMSVPACARAARMVVAHLADVGGGARHPCGGPSEELPDGSAYCRPPGQHVRCRHGPRARAAPQSASAVDAVTADYEMNEPPGTTVMPDSSGNGVNGVVDPTGVQSGATFDGATGYNWVRRATGRAAGRAAAHRAGAGQPERSSRATQRRSRSRSGYRTKEKFGNIIQKGQAASKGGQWKIENPQRHPDLPVQGLARPRRPPARRPRSTTTPGTR